MSLKRTGPPSWLADTNSTYSLPYGTVPCPPTQLMIVHLNCKLCPIGCQLHNLGCRGRVSLWTVTERTMHDLARLLCSLHKLMNGANLKLLCKSWQKTVIFLYIVIFIPSLFWHPITPKPFVQKKEYNSAAHWADVGYYFWYFKRIPVIFMCIFQFDSNQICSALKVTCSGIRSVQTSLSESSQENVNLSCVSLGSVVSSVFRVGSRGSEFDSRLGQCSSQHYSGNLSWLIGQNSHKSFWDLNPN